MESINSLEWFEKIDQNEDLKNLLSDLDKIILNSMKEEKTSTFFCYFEQFYNGVPNVAVGISGIAKLIKEKSENFDENKKSEEDSLKLVLNKFINFCEKNNFFSLKKAIEECLNYLGILFPINNKINSDNEEEIEEGNKELENFINKSIKEKFEKNRNITEKEKYKIKEYIFYKVERYSKIFEFKLIMEKTLKCLNLVYIDENNESDSLEKYINEIIIKMKKNKDFDNNIKISKLRKLIMEELFKISTDYNFFNLEQQLKEKLYIIENLLSINDKFNKNSQEGENNLKDFINKIIIEEELRQNRNLPEKENEDIKKLIIQKIFNGSIKNNLTKIAIYVYNNYKQFIDINKKYNFNGNKSLLSIAFENQNVELSRKLLEDESIELNLEDLIYCNEILENEQFAELLYKKYIEKKIDMNSIILNKGIRMIEYSCLERNINLLKFLSRFEEIKYYEPNKIGTLKFAINKENYEMTQFLLDLWKEKGKDIGINGFFGIYNYVHTPLSEACRTHNYRMAKLLKSYGAEDKENKIHKNSQNFEFYEKWDCIDDNIIFEENVKHKNKILYKIKYTFKENCKKYYSKEIIYFIGGKNFTAKIIENNKYENIIFDFKELEGITSEQFEKEIKKILNNFDNVECFDTYTSWLPLALIQFKKEEKQEKDKILFFNIRYNIKKVKYIIDNNLKNKEEDKILICDFAFSCEELKEDINSLENEEFKEKNKNFGHAISLVIFNSKDSNGNFKTKILAFNTGFKSKKAFKKFKENLGNDIEIIKIDKDIFQKNGSCNLSPKPIIEAVFSSGISIEEYANDMLILKKLRKLRKKYNEIRNTNRILTCIKNKIFLKDSLYKRERRELFDKINLEEFLERLQKYKEINERLTRNYFLFYSSSGVYVTNEKIKDDKKDINEEDNNNVKIKNKNDNIRKKITQINTVWKNASSLNENLNDSIKEVGELIEENRIQNLKDNLIDSIY